MEDIANKFDLNQYGKLKGSSTVHALVSITDDWCKQIDDSIKGNIIRILFVDYLKAFDRNDPNW